MSTMDFIFDPAVMTKHKSTVYCTDQLSNILGREGGSLKQAYYATET
jgi:hypothetical protein